MTLQEEIEQQNYQRDNEMREKIISQSLLICFKNVPQEKIVKVLKNKKDLQIHYSANYNEYLNQGFACNITTEIYSYGNFWFNDAGFQFQWKNHKRDIVNECLSWDKVQKRMNELIR